MTTTFADLGVPRDLCRRLHEAGIATPFPVQTMTLPDALAGRDLCGRAPTGSGKTLAFAIPLAALAERATSRRPRALVLVPTRELAAQVRDTLLPLAQQRRRRVATVYGGTSINRDRSRLRDGVDILVATPGRLADLVQRGDCDLGDVGLVVVDEADRMADMGFLPEVKRLLDRTAVDRQTLLFSATLDGDVDELISRYQVAPVRHALPDDPDTVADVRHVFWPADREQRRKLTGDIVRRVDRPAIVFTRTKHGADRLARQLATDGIATAAIHGNRSQGQRERALAQFRAGEVTTLVATDVAARGIHVDDVAVVVHYDLPGSDKDYVHRSGRTGRAGATGLVVCLVEEAQHGETVSLQRSLQLPEGLHPIDLDLLTAGTALPDPVVPAGARRGGGGRGGPAKSRPRHNGGRRPSHEAAGTPGRTKSGARVRTQRPVVDGATEGTGARDRSADGATPGGRSRGAKTAAAPRRARAQQGSRSRNSGRGRQR